MAVKLFRLLVGKLSKNVPIGKIKKALAKMQVPILSNTLLLYISLEAFL